MSVYANAFGHEIVGWEEDLDQPGSTLKRPGLQAALAAINAGEADGIIAAKLDRITRSIADLGRLLEMAKAGGWNLVAVDVGLDLGTSNGRLVAHVLGAVAEWELERRRESWQDARARAVARGVHIASRCPTGYRRLPDGRLEPDPVNGLVIAEVFRRRASGEGWRQLAGYVTGTGIETPYGNTNWTGPTVAKMIRNRVYLGEARHGVYVLPGAHQPLIDQATWDAVTLVKGRTAPRRPDPALLASLCRCAGCRYVMKVDTMRDASSGNQLRLYRCRGSHAAGRCPAPASILGRVLEPFVEHRFLEWLARDGPTADASQATAEYESALAENVAAEAELRAYVETTMALAGRDAFEHGLTVRKRRADETHERMLDARVRAHTFGSLTPGSLIAAWPTLSHAEKNEVLRGTLDAVVVWKHRLGRPVSDRARLVFRGDGPTDLPRRGLRLPLVGWPTDRPDDIGMATTEDL